MGKPLMETKMRKNTREVNLMISFFINIYKKIDEPSF